MKRALAILLCLVLVLSLAACGGESSSTNTPADNGGASSSSGGSASADNGGNSGSDAPSASGKAYPNANPDGSINLDRIGHYDSDYDYTQNPKYKVAYLVNDTGPLYQASADAFEHWCPLFNCEWAGYITAGGDGDMFITNLQNAIDQGVTGFILDPDSTLFPSLYPILEEYPEVQWMSMMSPPRDLVETENTPVGGSMIHPYVGFDNYDAGVQQAQKLIEWKNATYPDVPWSEVGFISMDYSLSPPLHARLEGAKSVWMDVAGIEENFFAGDAVTSGINMQAGIDTISPIISTHSEFKYWLVVGLIDDFSQAAATVLDQQGLTETSCVVDFGGTALQQQWDQGQEDSYRYALFTAQNLYCEPIFGAVYAFLNGWATPDTIWPSWINYNDCGADGHTYPSLRLPTVWLTHDDYKHYLEWTDMYAHADAYPYSQDGISMDDYTAFVDVVPPEYAPQG